MITFEQFRARFGLMKKAVSFGLVGVVNTGLDFCLFWIAVQKFGWPLVVANVFSWMIAVSGSYVMNSFFTFAVESGRKLRWRAYVTFLASGVAGLIANTATLIIAVWLMPLLIANENTQLALAKLCAIGASFVVNFSLSHFVVFRPRAGL